MKDRRQMWRILEFAALIAQEDEYAAMALFMVAANTLSFGHPLQRELAGLGNALTKLLTEEVQAPMFPTEQQNTPTQAEGRLPPPRAPSKKDKP
jgi:hypothetical protein